MKIYGYERGSDASISIDQITLQVDSNELAKLCEFLMQCLNGIESDRQWSHEHYSDFCNEELSPEIVVYNELAAIPSQDE